MSASKQSFAQEISRLEDKIETLRLENESNETVSENVNEDGKVDFDEFSKLSEAHRILQNSICLHRKIGRLLNRIYPSKLTIYHLLWSH